MSVQLSGSTPTDFTFTSDGTRAQLLTMFQAQLNIAGWTVISGGGTSHIIMESSITPQGLKIRVDVLDPGSGNCIQFKLKDNTTLVGPTTFFLLPVNGITFRLWANPYQFFYFLSGSVMTRQRAIVCGGVPWVPPFIEDFLSFSYNGWLHGNGTTDTDTTDLTSTFRSRFVASSIKSFSAIWNGVVFGNVGTINRFGLLVQSALTNLDDLWEDGTWTLFEPILVWDSANYAAPVRHGQMWDAVLLSKTLDSELRRTFGGLRWRNITHQNQLAGGVGRGSLLLVVPDQ
jgi:hypothetical protein